MTQRLLALLLVASVGAPLCATSAQAASQPQQPMAQARERLAAAFGPAVDAVTAPPDCPAWLDAVKDGLADGKLGVSYSSDGMRIEGDVDTKFCGSAAAADAGTAHFSISVSAQDLNAAGFGLTQRPDSEYWMLVDGASLAQAKGEPTERLGVADASEIWSVSLDEVLGQKYAAQQQARATGEIQQVQRELNKN